MDLDFQKMPRFIKDSMKIWTLIPQWAHAHQVPEPAIIAQLYIAHAWCDSNPKKAPKKNSVRFLWSWMAAAKRYGNLKVPQTAVPVPSAADTGFSYDMTPEEMDEIKRRNFPNRKHVA